MVSKSIDQEIPYRGEPCNQKGFAKRNPNIVYNQIAAMKIG